MLAITSLLVLLVCLVCLSDIILRTMKIKLQNTIVNDKYTQYLCDNYDIQNNELVTTEIPIPNKDEFDAINQLDDWNIFLIIGNSGSGKSTILRYLNNGNELYKPKYNYEKCVVSQFPLLSEIETCELLNGIGLSSIPTYLRLPQQLSNGEKYRLDVVKQLYDCKYLYHSDIVFIDEFTSVVNRDVAKSMSFALQRLARTMFKDMKIFISSCHYDIIDWLNPDYIFNLNKTDINGDVEIEKLIYEDNYKFIQIDECDILTDKYEIC